MKHCFSKVSSQTWFRFEGDKTTQYTQKKIFGCKISHLFPGWCELSDIGIVATLLLPATQCQPTSDLDDKLTRPVSAVQKRLLTRFIMDFFELVQAAKTSASVNLSSISILERNTELNTGLNLNTFQLNPNAISKLIQGPINNLHVHTKTECSCLTSGEIDLFN